MPDANIRQGMAHGLIHYILPAFSLAICQGEKNVLGTGQVDLQTVQALVSQI